MNPAQRVIEKCGAGELKRGIVVVSEITGVHTTRVYRWTYPKSRGGTGGTIPSQHQQALLDGARTRFIDLSPADFFELPGDSRVIEEGAAA